jgi:hypothetical protein
LQSCEGFQGGMVPLAMAARAGTAKAITSAKLVSGKGPMSPGRWQLAQRESRIALASR